jgi:hypothetical protein
MRQPPIAARPLSAVRRLLPDAAAVGLLWGSILIYLWPLVTPDESVRLYFGRGDLTDQFFAFRSFISAELWAGHLPLWNPFIYAGHPALADIQSAVFYPLTLICTLLAGRGGLPFYALQVEVLADLWLGALFMYMFARQITERRGSAMLATLVFSLGGFLTSYPPEQLPVLEGAIWLPLALFFAHRGGQAAREVPACAAASRWPLTSADRSVVWSGIALGVCVLAGHPQVSMLTFYLTLLYLVYGCWRRGDTWRLLLAPATAGLVGLAVGAVQLLPTAEFMVQSTRAVMPFVEAQPGFPLADLLSILFPGFAGRTAPLYVGMLPLLLAVAALLVRCPVHGGAPAKGRSWPSDLTFWSGVALVSLLLSFGGAIFLYSLPYLALPGFGLFRGQERLALIYTVAVAALAGFGCDRLAAAGGSEVRDRLRRARGPALWMVALVAGVAAFYATQSFSSPDAGLRVVFSFLRDRSVTLALAAGAAWLVIFARAAGRLSANVFLILALGVTVWDLTTVGQPYSLSGTDPTAYYEQQPAIVRALQDMPAPFRVRNDKVLPENFGALAGVSALEGNSPLHLRYPRELAAAVDEWRLWLLMDVRAVVTRGSPGAGAQLKLKEGEAGLYSVDQPRHAWVVGEATLAASDAEALAALAAPQFDPQQTAVVRDAGAARLDGLSGQAEVTVYQPQYIAVEARAQGRSLLVVSEMWYPGWQARVDGEYAPVYRVDHALRGVALTAGAHRVELVYAPRPFRWGAGISALALLFMAAATLWRRS